MSILKNAAIKGVTKKRTRQFTSLIEQGINSDLFQEVEINERVFSILKKLIETIENQEGSDSLNIDTNEIQNWKEILFLLVLQTVRSELSYDPSMGKEKDFELIEKIFKRELDSWKKDLSCFSNKKVIKFIVTKHTRELILFLEDGPKIDFFKALKSHIGDKIIEHPKKKITSNNCTKWSELFILIIWEATKTELSLDSNKDFSILSNTVLEELRQWEKTIRLRASIS